MREVRLPYGRDTRLIAVPEEKLAGVYLPGYLSPVPDLAEAVRSALANPLGGADLRRLAASEKSVAVLVDDVTRSVPTAGLLAVFLPYLEDLGFSLSKITVICAVGAHRPLEPVELQALVGRFAGCGVRAINHDPDDPESLLALGSTSLGTDLKINRTFLEADVKLIVCDTEYHQFCGYGGGAKSVLPGICDRASIETCHSRFEAPGAEPGRIQGNPVREEIEEAGRMAGVDFILNVVLNDRKEVVGVFAGDVFEAFQAGSGVVDRLYRVEVPRRVDTVIVSAGGWPKDINLYQAQKAIESAVRVVEKGGRIVLLAECPEGSGSKLFHEWMTGQKDLDTIIRKIREKFILGAHKAFQFARELKWATVYLYSGMDPGLIRSYYMQPLQDLQAVQAIVADAQSIVVLPQATTTLPILDGEPANNYVKQG